MSSDMVTRDSNADEIELALFADLDRCSGERSDEGWSRRTIPHETSEPLAKPTPTSHTIPAPVPAASKPVQKQSGWFCGAAARSSIQLHRSSLRIDTTQGALALDADLRNCAEQRTEGIPGSGGEEDLVPRRSATDQALLAASQKLDIGIITTEEYHAIQRSARKSEALENDSQQLLYIGSWMFVSSSDRLQSILSEQLQGAQQVFIGLV